MVEEEAALLKEPPKYQDQTESLQEELELQYEEADREPDSWGQMFDERFLIPRQVEQDMYLYDFYEPTPTQMGYTKESKNIVGRVAFLSY